MMKIIKYQGLTLLWALFTFIICMVDFGPRISKSHKFFPGFDKVTHCGLFLVLQALVIRGLLRKYQYRFNYLTAFSSLIIIIAYGGFIELCQLYLFTWRSADWDDFFCDGLGASMAAFSILVSLNAAKYAKI